MQTAKHLQETIIQTLEAALSSFAESWTRAVLCKGCGVFYSDGSCKGYTDNSRQAYFRAPATQQVCCLDAFLPCCLVMPLMHASYHTRNRPKSPVTAVACLQIRMPRYVIAPSEAVSHSLRYLELLTSSSAQSMAPSIRGCQQVPRLPGLREDS